ncbi:MAG: hypothetical protein JXB13_09035 [Phycisphaerae bacterium]|nr:hypothetical protein [Phycisphaerae bacterium]
MGILILLVVLAAANFSHIDHFLRTGHFFPIEIIESLNNPVQVETWTADGLVSVGGRTIPLPGVTRLPETSDALVEVKKRGIEVAEDGRVYGLVRIHHWCGNDPVREHLARIDIADLLRFLGEGEYAVPSEAEKYRDPSRLGSFSRWGWDVGEYYLYRQWLGLAAELDRPTTEPGSHSANPRPAEAEMPR